VVNTIDKARRDVAAADIDRVSANGWKIAHYQGFSGHNFIGERPGVRIRGEKHAVAEIALQRLLNLLLAYDAENPPPTPAQLS
jgi:hypothetical protein